MANIDNTFLQEVAVRCTERFLNDKVPLSQGLAKEASDAGLNSDQLKRCVEAANTVTYLKLMSISPDRTIEFPLAKYAEVMSLVATPVDAGPYVEKVASAPSVPSESLEKTASVRVGPSFSRHEAMVLFIKEAAANDLALEVAKNRGEQIKRDLMNKAASIEKDPQGLDKMACVLGDEFGPLSVLVTGTPQVKRDFGSAAEYMFKEAQLKPVRELFSLYKEASEVLAEIAKRTDLAEKAASVKNAYKAEMGGLMKEAGLVSGVAKAGKALVSNPVKAVTQAATSALTYPLAAPVKGIAAAGKGIVKATGKGVANAVKSTVAPAYNKIDPALGAKTWTPNITKNKIGGALAATGSVVGFAALDASMVPHPGYDRSTGQSKDVWEGLQ